MNHGSPSVINNALVKYEYHDSPTSKGLFTQCNRHRFFNRDKLVLQDLMEVLTWYDSDNDTKSHTTYKLR